MKDDKQNDRQGVALSEQQEDPTDAAYGLIAHALMYLEEGETTNAKRAMSYALHELSSASSSQGVALSDQQITTVWLNSGGSLSGNNYHAFARAVLRASSSQGVALSEAARRLMLAANDVDQGRAIHNERHPDRRIDGAVWKELRDASAAMRDTLLARASSSRAEVETMPADTWRELLEAVVRELPGHREREGNAPGHAHSIPGIWDGDNGAKAGKTCAWCIAWNAACNALAAAETPNGDQS